jgi:hypothetical protein
LKPKERENCVRSFVNKLYKITGDNKDKEVDRILGRLAPPVKKCNLQHLPETNQAKHISQNVQIYGLGPNI